MNSRIKWAGVLAAGCLLGILGVYAIFAIVFIAGLGTGFEFLKVKRGGEINPYMLISKIKHTAVILAASVFVYSIIAGSYIVGGLISIGVLMLSATLVHTIQTDVLGLDE